jgi:hypothetical protein
MLARIFGEDFGDSRSPVVISHRNYL